MPELAIIFTFVLIAAVIVFSTVNAMHKRTLEHKERREALDREQLGHGNGGSAKKVEQLEQRVRVLERLATDRGQDLALQIEELRESSGEALQFDMREKAQ